MPKALPPTHFLPARAKLWIGSLDDPIKQVRAQYNPKELQIDKSIPWGEHKPNDGSSGQKSKKKQQQVSQADLEFKGAPTRSMTVELLFDGYEEAESVEPDIRLLEELSSVQDAPANQPDLRRPHHCVVAWGPSQESMRPFRCVIESLSVKYTMWDRNGTPLRATCTVKLKEAQVMNSSKGVVPITLKMMTRPRGWDRGSPDAVPGESAEDTDR